MKQYTLFDFIDYQAEADIVFECIIEMQKSVRISLLTSILLGRFTKQVKAEQLYRLAHYGSLAEKSKEEIHELIHGLADRGYLQYRKVPQRELMVLLSRKGIKAIHTHQPILFIEEEISEQELARLEYRYLAFEQLRELRLKLLNEFSKDYPQIKLYHIARNDTLEEIARVCPRTLEELATIAGMTAEKVAAFGQDILSVLESLEQDLHNAMSVKVYD